MPPLPPVLPRGSATRYIQDLFIQLQTSQDSVSQLNINLSVGLYIRNVPPDFRFRLLSDLMLEITSYQNKMGEADNGNAPPFSERLKNIFCGQIKRSKISRFHYYPQVEDVDGNELFSVTALQTPCPDDCKHSDNVEFWGIPCICYHVANTKAFKSMSNSLRISVMLSTCPIWPLR